MAVERVGDMSIEELQKMIKTILSEHSAEAKEALPQSPRVVSQPLALDEILRLADQNRIQLPPGARSNQELLREDRDW